MTASQQILLLGASSYVGRSLFAGLGAPRAIATHNANPIENGIHFDSLSMKLSDLLATPNAVTHGVILLGDTKPDRCASDLPKSQALNVDSIKSIIDQLRDMGIKPVFISTEVVFDGTKGDYIESDEVNPILTYGRQKVEVEDYLQESGEDYAIVRLAMVFGAKRGDGTILTGWLDAIEQDQTSRCAYDYLAAPIYVDDAVLGMIRVIENDCHGVFHLPGPETYSRLDMYETLLAQTKKHGFDTQARSVSCSMNDFDLVEKRPLNVSMRPDKIVDAVGLTLTGVEEVCSTLVKEAFR